MIGPDKRKSIYCMSQEGMSIREIAQSLNVSPTTVVKIVHQKGETPGLPRKDKIEIDLELLRQLYTECNGYTQRIYERLCEKGTSIGYSTLSRFLRDNEIGTIKKQRCEQVADIPGAEMQHDTTIYKVKIGDKQYKVVASVLYFRYSKIRYLKFYRSFNRWNMKCFFHEALVFLGYSAPICIIDNTNLARLRGTGKNAVITSEMEFFAKQYGFAFRCHELNHPNRKAGNERSFFTVETNFLPGRSFETMEDLNQQALDWATIKMRNRAVAKTGLIPAKAFEHEQFYLIKISPHVLPPYLEHERFTDQYGYVSFAGNFYWIPGSRREILTVLQFSNLLKIFRHRHMLGEYELPEDIVKNQKFYPKGQSKPEREPENRKRPTTQEESALRNSAIEVAQYLDFATKPSDPAKHRFIRQLYALYKKLDLRIFIESVKRAHHYSITNVRIIESIAIYKIKEGNTEMPQAQIDQEFENRDSYLEGKFSGEVDLSFYDKLMEEQDE
ncbi:MAG: helix-turn-helix domain-containing protein [Candidatus Riflebacteria bacterium]|nr:helix-turn-helix domain-containing protein [Candidatus Riflebacteria bacterium]